MIEGPDVPFTPPQKNVGRLILDSLEKNPNHIGQIDADSKKSTTFAEMRDASIRCALWLRKQNIGSEDVVSFCGNDRMDAYIPLLASIYVGSIFNAWDYQVTLLPARHFMKLTRPKILFSMESALEVLMEAAKLENVDVKFVVLDKSKKFATLESLEDILKQQSARDVEVFEPKELKSLEEPAMIICSSGTTGLPKGVLLSYYSVFRYFYVQELVQPGDIFLYYATLFWISGILCTLRTICCQCTRILPGVFDVPKFVELVNEHQVKWAFLSPTYLTRLSKSKILESKNLPSLRCVIIAGSKMSQDILDDVRKNLSSVLFLNIYGMTEISGSCSTAKNNVTSAGFLSNNTQLKVVDPETSRVLQANEVGELCFKRPGMMLGYYKNPRATQEAFDSDGWYHSGDLGYYTDDGEIFITDRLKELMKYQNRQVSPTELESFLLTHPGITEVCVVPVPDFEDGERPMAFVVKSPEFKSLTADEIVEFSAKLGNSQKLWGGVQFLDKMPYTLGGKIAKKILRDKAKLYSR